MRRLLPKPTTSTFGNAWEPRACFPRGPGGPPWRHAESDVPRLSEKTVPATRPDRKHLLRRQTPALLARTRTPPSHPDPPSPTARPRLQSLPPEASVRSDRMSTEPNTYGSPRKCCKQKTYGPPNFLSCSIYKKHGGPIRQAKGSSPQPSDVQTFLVPAKSSTHLRAIIGPAASPSAEKASHE